MTENKFIPFRKGATDIAGYQFKRITVIGATHRNQHNQVMWLCICDCGSDLSCTTANIKSKMVTSCGCARKERIVKLKTTHNMHGIDGYNTWKGMRARCNDTNHPRYKDWGGRGITICLEWDDFAVFIKDMGKRPSPKHSIDRIDNNGNYCKENCKWSTPLEQAQNKRPYPTHQSKHPPV